MTAARSRWLGISLTVSLAVLIAAVGFHSRVGPSAAQADPEVQVVDFAFEPGSLTISAGTTVTWTNAGARPHTVTADDGSFDSGRLDPGEQFSHTFDQPGTFTYFCGFHPEMQGTIEVTTAEATSDVGAADDTGIEVASPQEDAATDEAGTPVPASVAAGASQELAPAAETRLAHIHAGTCEELGIVVYSLPDIRTYRLDQVDAADIGAIEMITGTANVPLGDLFGEPFSVHIHESSQEKQTYIACSDIGGRPPAPWSESAGLTLQAREQRDSGFRGFTTLRPTADGQTAVTITLAASTSAAEAVETQEAPGPSTTYTSPTFGYQISYGPTWQESESVSSNGRDRFVLFNGTSYITFTGAADFNGDPQTCVDAFVEQLTADPAVSNLGLAVDEAGNPLQGGTEATGAYAIYTHDYTFPDRVEPYTLFVGCVPLIPNEAVLAIVQNVPTADYNEQVELREALLRGLTLAQ